MLRVMIFDDAKTTLALKQTIDWKKWQMICVGVVDNIEDAFRIYQETRPDIVFCDFEMENGFEFLQKLKIANSKTQIIVQTLSTSFEYAYELLKLGITKLLSKPIDKLALFDAVLSARNNIADDSNYFNIHQIMNNQENNTDNFFSKVLAFIADNFAEKLSLNFVAEKFFVSNWHLSKLFKKNTGFSFIEVLNAIRIQKAQQLLANSTMKINEVAQSVGLSDVPYFTVVFKKYVKMSPLDYRNNRKVEDEHCLKRKFMPFLQDNINY